MSVYFQSICSSSSGNCLTLWTASSRLIIDCGLGSMRKTRSVLQSLGLPRADGVLLSHLHSDHISHYPLKTLESDRVPLYVHENCLDELKPRHFGDYGFNDLSLKPFSERQFSIGDFKIKPFAVPHMPGFFTCGFEIYVGDKKIVMATDFREWAAVFDRFVEADFIFVESNHDLELLRKYFNPNSRYHMPNPRTAELLVNVQKHSRRRIQTVMLGHISSQRNKPQIALDEMRRAFVNADLLMDFELRAAPLREPGYAVCIR
ncbi:MAG: MBL fold metallo-hydrolase [Planctomycetaceae bacterium]|nr:MBL fold metallo-hydrolase [Planctomycetaceae bacterium]